jgi:predicted SnoaL-like aldol condensation-catalyzing enzyme
MKSTVAFTVAALALVASTPSLGFEQNASPPAQASNGAPQPVAGSPLQANEKIAVGFYTAALNDKNPDAAMKFILPDFRQHSVLVEDGYAGLRKFLEWVRTEQPNLHADITRVFTDGDYVILDVRMIRHPGDRGLAIAEIYRVQDGKLAEHWDRIQEIPEKSKNANGLF